MKKVTITTLRAQKHRMRREQLRLAVKNAKFLSMLDRRCPSPHVTTSQQARAKKIC